MLSCHLYVEPNQYICTGYIWILKKTDCSWNYLDIMNCLAGKNWTACRPNLCLFPILLYSSKFPSWFFVLIAKKCPLFWQAGICWAGANAACMPPVWQGVMSCNYITANLDQDQAMDKIQEPRPGGFQVKKNSFYNKGRCQKQWCLWYLP